MGVCHCGDWRLNERNLGCLTTHELVTGDCLAVVKCSVPRVNCYVSWTCRAICCDVSVDYIASTILSGEACGVVVRCHSCPIIFTVEIDLGDTWQLYSLDMGW